MSEWALRCTNLNKSFGTHANRISVLSGLDLEVAQATQVAIVGSSGSGKSTLLHLLAGLDRPDSGRVEIAGQNVSGLADRALSSLRNQSVGFVYQRHHLLPEFSACENVAMPLLIAGRGSRSAAETAKELLEQVGLGARLTHKPGELSGGERQRVAVCRALAMHPGLVLADEPTGSLDHHSAQEVFTLMRQLAQTYGISLVLVTHDETLAKQMPTGYRLWSGKLNREW